MTIARIITPSYLAWNCYLLSTEYSNVVVFILRAPYSLEIKTLVSSKTLYKYNTEITLGVKIGLHHLNRNLKANKHKNNNEGMLKYLLLGLNCLHVILDYKVIFLWRSQSGKTYIFWKYVLVINLVEAWSIGYNW
jgi:hypothetical protein